MQYETDRFVEKATDLFWQRGFNATGMRDIQAALDLRPGSIYARYKSKTGLFERVIAEYVSSMQARLTQVADAVDPLHALRAFFYHCINTPTEGRYKRQCLLIKSLAEIDALPAASRQIIERGMQTLHKSFCGIVDALIANGALASKTHPDVVASWLQNQFVGLRTYASTHDDVGAVCIMIDKVLLDLQGNWPSALTADQQSD